MFVDASILCTTPEYDFWGCWMFQSREFRFLGLAFEKHSFFHAKIRLTFEPIRTHMVGKNAGNISPHLNVCVECSG